jgi:hypothetical protein
MSGGEVRRLSLPARQGPCRSLTPPELDVVLRFADTLIPESGKGPCASAAPQYLEWLADAIVARADSFERFVGALAQLGAIPEQELWCASERLAASVPEDFH